MKRSANAFTRYKFIEYTDGICQEHGSITDINCVKLLEVCPLLQNITRIRKEIVFP